MASPFWGSFQCRLAIRRHNNTKMAFATYFTTSFVVCKRFPEKKTNFFTFFVFQAQLTAASQGNCDFPQEKFARFSSQIISDLSDEHNQRKPSPTRWAADFPPSQESGRAFLQRSAMDALDAPEN
jgi:hypothetical protein